MGYTDEEFISKVYNKADSSFAEIGNNHKVDVRTVWGKGLLKDIYAKGINDAFTEELCYHVAKFLGVPCVFTKMIKTNDVFRTFSRYEYDAASPIKTLAKTIKIEDPDSTLSIYKRLPEHTQQMFLLVCAFDYVTRQIDRNTQNLSFYKLTEEMYPLYDNGLSFFVHQTDDKISLTPEFRMRHDNSSEVLRLIKSNSTNETKRIILSWEVDLNTCYACMEYMPKDITAYRRQQLRLWVRQSLKILKELFV